MYCAIDVEDKIAVPLLDSLVQGPIVNDKGQRTLTEAQVARFGGFRVDIFADEHPPPHFRVSYAGETANFRITDGEKLNGGLERFNRNILKWYFDHRDELIATWNARRPTDCPVGEVRV